MIGITNAQLSGRIQGEKVIITLLTNQLEHTDLLNAEITVIHSGITTKYKWEGNSITVDIPVSADYEITVSDIEGYITPNGLSFTSVSGNVRAVSLVYQTTAVAVDIQNNQNSTIDATVTIGGKELKHGEITKLKTGEVFEVAFSDVEGYKTPEPQTITAANAAMTITGVYQAEQVVVGISASDDSDMNGVTVNINGTDYTYEGSPIKVLVPFGTEYSVIPSDSGSFVNPGTKTFVASQMVREVDFVYFTSALVVNMLSNQVNDATIAALKYTVSYSGTTIEVDNGAMIDIPTNISVTITFPYVVDYDVPDPITIAHTSGLSETNVTYTTELVKIQAYTDNGISVDGTSVSIKRYDNRVANGVYALDMDGTLYGYKEWPDSSDIVGIVIVADECSFIVAPGATSSSYMAFGEGYTTPAIEGISYESGTRGNDMNGISNTLSILEQTTSNNAARLASQYWFKNGAESYLGSSGEWKTLTEHASTYKNFASALGFSQFGSSTKYWTSTGYKPSSGWIYAGTDSNGNPASLYYFYSSTDQAAVWAFGKFDATLPSEIETKEYVGGKANFKVKHETDYTIIPGDKASYKTPSPLSFTSSRVANDLIFEYKYSALKVKITSNQPNDTIIQNVKAAVKIGTQTIEASNGSIIDLYGNTDGVIIFPDIEGYKTPEPVPFSIVSGLIEREGHYAKEKVTVSVLADNGVSMDGNTISVAGKRVIEYIPDNGVYIQDVKGFLYTEEEWDGTKEANGVAVVTDECQFVVALTQASTAMAINGSGNSPYETVLKYFGDIEEDYNGASNTENMLKLEPSVEYAAGWCHNYVFPNGEKGYMPAAGEMLALYQSGATGNLLVKAGGTTILNNYYWSSTFNGLNTPSDSTSSRRFGKVNLYSGSDSFGYPSATNYVRAFGRLKAYKYEDIAFDETVTDSQVNFDIAHGTEYTVSASFVEDYTVPLPQVHYAGNVTNHFNMQYTYTPKVDLSKVDIYGNKINQTTANCYVISQAGEYRFPIAYGAAIKNGKVNSAAFTGINASYTQEFVNYLGKTITSPYIEDDTTSIATTVQMSISDTKDAVTELQIINGVGCRYVSFKVPVIPATGGNAVISIKNASGVIMWSWHIWLWADSLTPIEITNAASVSYNIMPVNLGSKWDDDAHIRIKNWGYQWGRPVPMLCASAYNSTTYHESYGELTFNTVSEASSFKYGIINPTYYYGEDSYDSSWGIGNFMNAWDASCTGTGLSDKDTVKTVYDPCPVGWKIPCGNVFSGFTEENEIGDYDYGQRYKRYVNDVSGVFIASSPYINSAAISVSYTSLWTSAYESTSYCRCYALRLQTSNVQGASLYPSYSVRPVADTSLEGQTKLTVTRIDQSITDPGAMISRIVDLGGIEAVRANSHRYTGELNDDGVMELKQLDDTDSTKYADGTAANLVMLSTDVWMKLPQFYWKCVEVDTDIWDIYFAYGAKPDETYNTWDGKDLIGVYEGYVSDEKLYSVSGQISTSNVTPSNFKSYAQARGKGYSLVKWKHHCMMAMLFYAQYSNTNSQSSIGYGEDNYAEITGKYNSSGMEDYGYGTVGVAFWGLEYWWCNKYEIIDNVEVVNNSWTIVEDDGTRRVAGTSCSSSGFISKMLFGENIDLVPTAVDGSETTGFCDYYYNVSSTVARVPQRSHSYNDSDGGVASINLLLAATSSSYDSGTRLAYRGDYTIKE